jgi:hypothetical protein
MSEQVGNGAVRRERDRMRQLIDLDYHLALPVLLPHRASCRRDISRQPHGNGAIDRPDWSSIRIHQATPGPNRAARQARSHVSRPSRSAGIFPVRGVGMA